MDKIAFHFLLCIVIALKDIVKNTFLKIKF